MVDTKQSKEIVPADTLKGQFYIVEGWFAVVDTFHTEALLI
jgi:hypothetical protein